MIVSVGFTVACLAALLLAHARQSRLGIWLAKPSASAGFILASVDQGALHSAYGRWLLVAQGLGWVGDVLLIFRQAAAFKAGLGVFLLGHLVYAAAFLAFSPPHWGIAAITAATLLGAGLMIARWLMPWVPRSLQTPVRMYLAVISLMVLSALAGAPFHPHPQALVAGTIFFYLSDFCVARQRFVAPGLVNQLIGLPLYYAAQLLLSSTIAPSG